jgi:hypothetical protein
MFWEIFNCRKERKVTSIGLDYKEVVDMVVDVSI